MSKTILITGSTDGIGLATAKKLISMGHKVLLHGRSIKKLSLVEKELSAMAKDVKIQSYSADLSKMSEVEAMASLVMKNHEHLDVLINNAGVLKTKDPITKEGFDVRFVVNTLAPYLLTRKLLPLLNSKGRVINLSSAAQAPVDIKALLGQLKLSDLEAYAQSKLAIIMWSFHLAHELKNEGPTVIAVNPGSLLASKMVKESFGTEGKDIGIGVDILTRLSLDDEFEDDSGKYFDNDSGQFAPPHTDALDEKKVKEVIETIENILAEKLI